MKNNFLIIAVFILSVIVGCKKDIDTFHYKGDGVVVKLTGIAEANEGLGKLASVDGLEKQTIRIPYEKDLSILATLTPIEGKKLPTINKLASTTVPPKSKDTLNAPFADQTKILALAYDNANKNLKENVVFTYDASKAGGDEILFNTLEVGKSYTIILLSNNTTTAPSVPNGNLDAATLAGLTDNTELLYFKKEISIVQGRNTLEAKLKHVFSEVSMEITIDQVGTTLQYGHAGSVLKSLANPVISPAYSSVNFKLSDGSFSSKTVHATGKRLITTDVTSANNQKYVIASQKIIVDNEDITLEIPSLTVNQTTNPVKLSGFKMRPGVRYTLKLEIGCPCTEIVAANGNTTNADGYFSLPWRSAQYTRTFNNEFTFVGSDFGAVLDIFRIDNSFNLEINDKTLMLGTKANGTVYNEMQFQGWYAWPDENNPPNILFADGSKWGVGSVPEIFDQNDQLEFNRDDHLGTYPRNYLFEKIDRKMSSNNQWPGTISEVPTEYTDNFEPIIKVIISKDNKVSLLGSKNKNGGEPYYPLVLANGSYSLPNASGKAVDGIGEGNKINVTVDGELNPDIKWNPSSGTNKIKVTQTVFQKTIFVGRITGQKVVPCSQANK